MHNEPIGQILSEARNRLGKSIKEVEFDTKIRAKYLDALERDDFDNLQATIYTQGFIKTYANYLGLDPVPLIQQYRGLYAYKDENNLESLSSNIRVKARKKPAWLKPAVAIGAIIALFIGLIGWGAYQQYVSREPKVVVQDIKVRKPTSTTVAGTTVTTNAETNKKSDLASGNTGDNNTTGNIVVRITGIGDGGSWTKVSVDGEKSFEGVIKKGETKEFKGSSSVRARIGNVTNVEIVYNGKKLTKTDYKTVNGIFDETFTPADKTTTTTKSSTTKTTTSQSYSSGRSTTTTTKKTGAN